MQTTTLTTTTTLRQILLDLVTGARDGSQPDAAARLAELAAAAEYRRDWRGRQLVRLAVAHIEK